MKFGLVVWAATGSRVMQAEPRIVFDYTYDTAEFFNVERREIMELAADSVNRWVDALSPIVASGGNNWTAQFIRPDTGLGVVLPGSSVNVPADDIRIFVGARDLGEDYLGLAHVNGAVATGPQDWINTVRYRGQTTGPPYVDFGPWGGSISFNSNRGIDWYSKLSPQVIAPEQYDLFTVAAHEILHVLGFGTAASYFAITTTGDFSGPHATAAGSLSNPTLSLSADGGHWIDGTTGSLAGSQRPSILTPTISPGVRIRPTDLDLAAADDVGWESAMPGDADRNRIVDFSDAFTLGANYGMQHAGGWSKGDFDGDGHVAFNDAFVMGANYRASYAMTSGSQDAAQLSAIYDPASGQIWLADKFPSEILALRITSESGLLIAGEANWLEADTSFLADDSSSVGFVTLISLGNTYLPSESLAVGKILPAGLAADLLYADLRIEYAVQGHVGILTGDISYLAVPEPASMTLGCLALLALVNTEILNNRRNR